MKKLLLLFFALSVVFVSACTGTTGTGVDEDKNVDVTIGEAYEDDLTTANNANVESEILDQEENVTVEEKTADRSDTDEVELEDTTNQETEEGPEFVYLIDASIDMEEVSWQDELTVSFGINNNETRMNEYNVIIQIFDEDKEKIYDQQEEGLNVLRERTKQFEIPVKITNTFKKGETYEVHVGLFDDNWKLIEWDWAVGEFTVQ